MLTKHIYEKINVSTDEKAFTYFSKNVTDNIFGLA